MATEMKGLKFGKWADGDEFFTVKGSHFKFYFKHVISDKFKGFIKALPEGFTIRLIGSKDKAHPDCIFVHQFKTDKYKGEVRATQRRIVASNEMDALQMELSDRSFRVHSSNRGRGVQTGGSQTMSGLGAKRSDKTIWKKRVTIGEDV